ncbi:phosphoglycerate mutase [Lineolata rhizophorae]|uniref:Phosphoglycerate mutase n=1 Tax=Lineolata rhizophorae TaxID=578093 RepID=A0A6A6P3M2_9PEZI|nr:phosphoglycerate mutase [Lineolata rhizophorae]
MGEATGYGGPRGPHHPPSSSHPREFNYSTVRGIFLQDDPATNASDFDYTTVNLGLIDRSYETDHRCDPHGTKTQWERFVCYLNHLNRVAPHNVQYKLLIMGRHGEGYHNVAESYYGTEAWDCYWSLLDGNGTITWADAHITPEGADQAVRAHAFWHDALANGGIPAPQSYYVSPLARCLETARLTFSAPADLPFPADAAPFVPTIKELLREAIGIHTCDRRSSKAWIAQNYPGYVFEEGFAEEDPLWEPDERETNAAMDARLAQLLDNVFASDERSSVISFTSHSGALGSVLRVLGHREFRLVTGAVIPVLVRAERRVVERPSPTGVLSTGPPTCEVDPTASVGTG